VCISDGIKHDGCSPVDIYLTIAERVLRESRQPLGPREILTRAYVAGSVPARLYGEAQHKTLQARISEDILLRRERSNFFRTAPGRFFLREFLWDHTIPEKYRKPIVARRRQRELAQKNVLAFDQRALAISADQSPIIPVKRVLQLIKSKRYRYVSSTCARGNDEILVWSFVSVMREGCILTYRHGRYREGRDAFVHRRSVGFFAPVIDLDLGLFDQLDHGIVARGLRTVAIDLDIRQGRLWDDIAKASVLSSFVQACGAGLAKDLLGVVRLEIPDWFQPITRRLAINDLKWHDLQLPVNHIEDFDPWSRLVLQHILS